MARSWQYPRWRRVVVQVVLWGVFGTTVGVAALVVRHKRLVGSVELAGPRSVDLPGGLRLTVRLPKGWPVDHDAAEHAAATHLEPSGEAVEAFEAHEPAGGAGDEPRDEDGGPVLVGGGRLLAVLYEPLAGPVSAADYLARNGWVATSGDGDGDDDGSGGAAAAGGTTPMAGGSGQWVATVGGRPASHPIYVAAAVVPAGPDTPVPMAVTVELNCPYGDPIGDRDVLRLVAGGVKVDRDRAPAARPTPEPHPGR